MRVPASGRRPRRLRGRDDTPHSAARTSPTTWPAPSAQVPGSRHGARPRQRRPRARPRQEGGSGRPGDSVGGDSPPARPVGPSPRAGPADRRPSAACPGRRGQRRRIQPRARPRTARTASGKPPTTVPAPGSVPSTMARWTSPKRDLPFLLLPAQLTGRPAPAGPAQRTRTWHVAEPAQQRRTVSSCPPLFAELAVDQAQRAVPRRGRAPRCASPAAPPSGRSGPRPELREEHRRVLRVQVPGGLVGQDHGRVVQHGPAERDPLLLAPGERRRVLLGPLPDAQPLEETRAPPSRPPPARGPRSARRGGRSRGR